MPKRFTETNKWFDPWFMDLPVKYKLFWLYICDQCDIAGFWDPNMRLAVAQVGEPMELTEILRVFEKRIVQIPNGKLWIRKFIEFQQGPELNPANNAHFGILNRLNQNKIASPIPIKEIKNNGSPYQRAAVGLVSPTSTSKGNSKGKEEEPKQKSEQPLITKFGLPLPPRCTIDKFGNVLDYTGRVMDINQVRKAATT